MQQRIQDIDRLGHLVFEAIHQRKDGTSFPVLVEVTTIKDQQGRPVSRVVYAVDITERNQVMAAKQKAQALNQAIIESIPGSFFMLDEQGRFLRWNAHERDEILGLPDDQILGTDALETVHPQEREELRSKLAAVLADGGVRTAECRRRIRGGPAERWFLMTGRRMLIEGRPCLIGIGVDITERKRIEAALIEAQRLAKVGSWESGAKPGTFIWSDELYRIYGRDPALGSTDFQGVSAYLSPASQAALGAAKEQALRQGIPYECDAEVIRPDGTRRWVTSRGEPMRDAQGNITGLRGTTQDITERKQVEASLREERLRLAAIIEATHVGTWEWNLQTGQTTLNERWAEIIGYALADLAPTSFATWEKFTHPDDLQTCNALLERHIQGELDYYECEARMRHRDGHWVWVLDRGKVTSWADDGKPLLMQGTHTDITGRKQTELERERLNQELETKNREFQNVLYAASHDLRSPMLNVQGFSRQLDQVCHELAGLLDASTGSHPDPQAALQIVRARIPRALEFIGSSVEKMDVLINGMLRLSRLGQVVLRRQALDMNQLLQQIAATMMIQIQTANAALRIEPLPGCSGDLMLINQVFSNLLDNALKYREPSRPLVIRVTGRQVGAETHYCVADNGQGIAGGQVDRIWNLFCRLDPSGPPGEGLGLNLVRRIVERHDGRVWAESTLHEGSQFFVALPAAMAEPPATDFAK
jgi:PAS domain S-box-containing protein